MFNEKDKEYSAKDGMDIPVVISPKYRAAKEKAISIINEKKYGLKESDFWILMNRTKKATMLYSGLIISHNGCLKINDSLSSKFVPSCVSLDKQGYNNSLVYSYCNDEQGIYEVGEVSKDNLQNTYPYAMAYKRLFDRVVLKLCKLAYDGIYSDSESDEFKERYEDKETEDEPDVFEEKATKEQCKRICDLAKQLWDTGAKEQLKVYMKPFGAEKTSELKTLDADRLIKQLEQL